MRTYWASEEKPWQKHLSGAKLCVSLVKNVIQKHSGAVVIITVTAQQEGCEFESRLLLTSQRHFACEANSKRIEFASSCFVFSMWPCDKQATCPG